MELVEDTTPVTLFCTLFLEKSTGRQVCSRISGAGQGGLPATVMYSSHWIVLISLVWL